MRKSLLLLAIALTAPVFAQRMHTALLYENLGGPAPMQWVTQRFQFSSDLGPFENRFGLETQSAVWGNYGGFYVFGLAEELRYPQTGWLQGFAGTTLATGGGAGAPDGDGLMYRLYGGLAVEINDRFALEAAYHYLDFPSGNITSTHPSVGFSYRMPYQVSSGPVTQYFRSDIGVINSVYRVNAASASRVDSTALGFYTGIRLGQEVGVPGLLAEIQLGASAIGPLHGFMNYSMGMSMQSPGRVKFVGRYHLGSGGGGSVETGGGLAHHFGGGLQYGPLELMAYRWQAIETGAALTGLEVTFRRPFLTDFAFVSSGGRNRDAYIERGATQGTFPVVLLAGPRVQFARGTDLNGLEYNTMASIFLGGKMRLAGEGSKWWLAGETLWAASGGYGAYAEGMFGVYGDLYEQGKLSAGVNASLAAAGGGGIDVGIGTAFAGGIHAGWSQSQETKWVLVARKKMFFGGTYRPWVVGLQLEQTLPLRTVK